MNDNSFMYIYAVWLVSICTMCSIACFCNGLKQKKRNIELDNREKELDKLECYLDKKYERLYLWESKLNEYHDNLVKGKK